MRRLLYYILAATVLLAACSEDTPRLAGTGNLPPSVLIQSPVDARPDPTRVLARPTLVVRLTDPDDGSDHLSFRWVFLSINPFGQDWTAAEDFLRSAPDSIVWSGWKAYAPRASGMAVVADSLDVGFYVLAVQARDPSGTVSEIDSTSVRRVLADNGVNDRPVVTISSPPGGQVSNVPSRPLVEFMITDPDDRTEHLSFRVTTVDIRDHYSNWGATERFIRDHSEEVDWSDWEAYAPGPHGYMETTLPGLPQGDYVLAVQAREASGGTSSLLTGSMRRVRTPSCQPLNVTVTTPDAPGPVAVPPDPIFEWVASGYTVSPDEIATRWAIVDISEFNNLWDDAIGYLREDPTILARYGKTESDVEAEWTAWETYPGGTVAANVGPLQDQVQYVFAVQARNPCWVTDLVEQYNLRRIAVDQNSAGLLKVYNPYIGPVHSDECEPAPVTADILSSVPMQFTWTAGLTPYGASLVDYRYGWDIIDPEDDSQWEIDFTPFVADSASAPARAFSSSTHTFHVESRTEYGACSRVEIVLNVIPYAPTRNLLVVDDFAVDGSIGAGWDDPMGKGIVPNDAEHDQFWLDMLTDVEGFDPATDVIEVTGNARIPLSTLAEYRNIIWSTYALIGLQTRPLLSKYLEYQPRKAPTDATPAGARDVNSLGLFMEAGGHLLITGHHPLTTTLNPLTNASPRFPFMFLYDHEDQEDIPDPSAPEGDQSFPYVHLSLETMDFAIPTTQTVRTAWYWCGIDEQRPITSSSPIDDGMRSAIPLDPSFPALALRPEAAGTGKAYAPDTRSYDAEVYNPTYFFSRCQYTVGPRAGFEPIYGLDCPNTSSVNYTEPVAFWTSAFAGRSAPGSVAARSAVFGFAPVYFNPAQVKPAIEHILFNEWQIPQLP